MRLIDHWDAEIKRLWSIRVAVFWIAVGAGLMVAPLISDELKAMLGPWQFGGLLFLAAVSFGIARLTKQPGADNDP